MDKEIKLPWWLHIVSFLIWITFTIFLGGMGIIPWLLLLSQFKKQYVKAIQENKNPIWAYIKSELLWLMGFVIIGIIIFINSN